MQFNTMNGAWSVDRVNIFVERATENQPRTIYPMNFYPLNLKNNELENARYDEAYFSGSDIGRLRETIS